MSLLTFDPNRREHMLALIERIISSAGSEGVTKEETSQLADEILELQGSVIMGEALFQKLMQGTYGIRINPDDTEGEGLWGPFEMEVVDG